MALPSVTVAQYRALEQVEAGNVSFVKGGGWLFSSGARHAASRDVYQRIVSDHLADLGAGVLIGRTLIYPVAVSSLGQQVLDAKRGEGDRG